MTNNEATKLFDDLMPRLMKGIGVRDGEWHKASAADAMRGGIGGLAIDNFTRETSEGWHRLYRFD